MRIPITMCHGIRTTTSEALPNPLSAEHFDSLMKIAADMGFESINYDDLEAWREGSITLPERPIMIDFDHPVRSLRYEVLETLERYGFRGNLFMYTKPYDEGYDRPLSLADYPEHMTWEEIGDLVKAGWHIGAHTVTHPNLSQLSQEDPTGVILRNELDRCNRVIQQNLGIAPRDFAFTGTSWSSMAEQEVMKRYRFGRLWFIGAEYEADGKPIRCAHLVGVPGPDEEDGGPPRAARYITRESNPYRLPSMELQGLINGRDAFRKYLEEALEEDS